MHNPMTHQLKKMWHNCLDDLTVTEREVLGTTKIAEDQLVWSEIFRSGGEEEQRIQNQNQAAQNQSNSG